MDQALRNYIGAVALYATAENDERRGISNAIAGHFLQQLIDIYGANWVLLVEASFAAKEAIYDGHMPIDAIDVGFKTLRDRIDPRDFCAQAA